MSKENIKPINTGVMTEGQHETWFKVTYDKLSERWKEYWESSYEYVNDNTEYACTDDISFEAFASGYDLRGKELAEGMALLHEIVAGTPKNKAGEICAKNFPEISKAQVYLKSLEDLPKPTSDDLLKRARACITDTSLIRAIDRHFGDLL